MIREATIDDCVKLVALSIKVWLYTWVEKESNGFYEDLGFSRIGLLNFEFAGALIENNVYQSTHT
ncbi:hypothetical protein KO489_07705 [Reinekea forsetii]|nr:hypothetical protein [Reinekea forsetii]